MSNGLTLTAEEFAKIRNVNQKLNILFENQQTTNKLIMGYKVQQKVNSWMLGISFAALTGVFSLLIKHMGL
jgi:hypothetical protein